MIIRIGIYLKISKNRPSNVNFVQNSEKDVISSQYHCVFDEILSTVWSDGQCNPSIRECLVQ